ncbi:MAG: amino acid ABC transporter permease [Burkholderiaceae bacterium]
MPAQPHWHWRNPATRSTVYQALLLAGLLALLALLVWNTHQNLRARGIPSGFDFLWQPAGFGIGESLWRFDAAQSYAQAFVAGLGNTLRVALPGIALATVLGTLVGVGRLSGNALLRGVCRAYVEWFRNIPLLLHLLMAYLLLTEFLPDPAAAIQLGPLFWSKGGLSFPVPLWDAGALWWSLPRQGEFAVEGGGALTPEFLALWLGLSLYTAAFVAELVRAGIASVPQGQRQAAQALGLRPGQVLRAVVMPQALRLIVPPLTNQYLSLTKNSSLAVAIGYPELVSIANTAINQTGRAVECIAIVMAVYLSLSLLTALAMNAYNQRVRRGSL